MKYNCNIERGGKFVMPAQWTGELVSMVLNGHREPPDAETKFTEAVNSLISEQSQHITR